MNFIGPGYVLSDGSVLFDPSVEAENGQIEIDGAAFGYVRSLALRDKSAQFAVALANVCLSGSADYRGRRYERDVCGWSDAKLRVGWNFIGAPAVDLREFASYSQDLIVGASVQLGVPTGHYDPARLANIGTNRWSVKGELGLSKAVERWTFEAALAGTFYEDNGNYFGGQTLERDPLYSLQAHVIRGLSSGIWLALDATYYRGGETATDGVADDNPLSNSRVGMTASFPINSRQSVKLAASVGVAARTGNDFDALALVWQYRWGAGL